MNNGVIIFSETASSRLNYVCRLVFTQHLGLDFSITTNYQEFTAYPGAKLLYRRLSNNTDIHIVPDSLLFETGIESRPIITSFFNGAIVPFATGQQVGGEAFPFDMLAAIFYLVSRYEEYLPFTKNQYGQFKAADSLASRLGFLDKPVVDIWIQELKAVLENKFPHLIFKEKKFETTFTYDIDVAYAYLGRTVTVTTANFIRDCFRLNFKKIKERYRVMSGAQRDPFDTYGDILQQQEIYGHQLLFFFLVGQQNKFNRNLPPSGRKLQQLITELTVAANTGIHPSYYTDTDLALLQSEKQLLESIGRKTITSSRQHYLRLCLPETYNNLIKAGITHDYSMCFAEMPGFRAGTCTAFNFYDLAAEEETALVVHPNTFMEGTFIEDMKLQPIAAQSLMKQLVDEVKKVNGHFISIWHNHSLSNKNEWEGLRAVHDAVAAYAAALK